MPPSFCRHNRFVENCPICRSPQPAKPARAAARSKSTRPARGTAASPRARGGMRVRKVAQAADDGYRNELVAGVRASADAERLAAEIAFAAARLAELAADPPEHYATIAAQPDREEALWLAFLTAYLSPTDDDDPFGAIRSAHVPWSGGELPDLAVGLGIRTSHDHSAGPRTALAYRAWAERAGSQSAAFAGELAWTPQRRFDRLFERLALPGLGRCGRYELLVSLGLLGIVDAVASSLQLTDDATTVAAKRVFGIGDRMLLERRARDLAEAAAVPIETLDLALFNWAAPPTGRATMGSHAEAAIDELQAIGDVLGV